MRYLGLTDYLFSLNPPLVQQSQTPQSHHLPKSPSPQTPESPSHKVLQSQTILVLQSPQEQKSEPLGHQCSFHCCRTQEGPAMQRLFNSCVSVCMPVCVSVH